MSKYNTDNDYIKAIHGVNVYELLAEIAAEPSYITGPYYAKFGRAILARIDALMEQRSALKDVIQERKRQNAKWGFPQRAMQDLREAMVVLGEEYGEACKAVTEIYCHAASKDYPACEKWRDNLREELVQTAAVAISIIEHMDAHIARTVG